jgi:hypothetical protein
VNSLNAMWCKHLPEFVHDFAGFEPLAPTCFSRLVHEARLDEVTPEDMAELLDSHGWQLSIEDVEELAKELSQQKEGRKKKMKSLI